MSSPPRHLLLDVMDTLVVDPFRQAIPAHLGLTLPELLARKDPTAWPEFERGEIDEATYLRRFFRDGPPPDGPALRACLSAAYRWVDDVEPLLRRLAGAGASMHALSNYPVWYELIEARLGVSRYVPWTFVSWRTGLRKPDPRAYLEAARALGASPSECLFVDDRPGNCAAAEAVGMPAVRFEDAVRLTAELRRRGIPGA